jgi:peptidoglycan-N-acetylglucosamine deacetylase
MTLRSTVKQALLAPFAVFRGPSKRNAIALTFDDGPHPVYTSQISRTLRDAGARATFFMVGDAMERHPALVQQLRDDGHELGSHSMSHPEMKDLARDKFAREIDAMYELRDPQGRPWIGNRYFRPPKGVITLSSLRHCAARGYKLVFWNRDPEDYAAHSAAQILAYFDKQKLRHGDIVLLHDKTQQTADALPGLLKALRAEKLQPVTLTELLSP